MVSPSVLSGFGGAVAQLTAMPTATPKIVDTAVYQRNETPVHPAT